MMISPRMAPRGVARLDMTVTTLVLLSASLHPLWNLILKGNPYPETVFMSVLAMTVILGMVHALASGHELTSIVRVWPLVVVSGFSVGVHGVMLVLALGRGDLSVYYPIIRSAPLGVVGIGFIFLGQTFTPALLLGIALVVSGTFFLQRRPGARFLSDPLTLGYAMCAMLTSAIYSIVDAAAVQQVPPVIVFLWQSVVALPTYLFLLWIRQQCAAGPGTRELALSWASRIGQHLVAGTLAYISYLLILWAYQRGGDVAAVTSVRQASIPISVLGAALLLKEPSLGPRLLWASVLAFGIVVVIASG